MKRAILAVCFLACAGGCGGRATPANPFLLPRSALHDHDLGGRIYDRMLETMSPDATSDADVLSHANRGQRLVWVLRAVDDEIANGGYYQLFWNSTGDEAEEAVRDARLIGNRQWAALLSAAIARTFPDGVPGRAARQRAIGCPGYCDKDRYGDLEDRWRGIDSGKLDAYIRAHPQQFFADNRPG